MKTSRTLLRSSRVTVVAVALLAMTASSAFAEHEDIRYRSTRGSIAHLTADGNLVDVQVRVEGRTAPLYFRPGAWDRHYFQAFKGQNYSLVVRNNTGRRVGVLIAVDGLNVVNGERSRFSPHESMYVLDPWDEAVIHGWRTSLDQVRRFVFVDEERSYAERTGQANGDMGWIRVLSFQEKGLLGWRNPAPWRERNRDEEFDDRRDSGESRRSLEETPRPSGDLDGPRAQLEGESFRSKPESKAAEPVPGTGWGSRRHDPVRRTHFNPERHATDQLVLRYEYSSGLRALGIFPQRSRLWERDRGYLGFAQPPRW